MRLFCLTLHFYSPKAYEYIRKTFNSNLPHIRTIRKWYSSINGSPGFTDEAFDALRQRATICRAAGKILTAGLIYDEMSIRKHSQWDSAKKEFNGHITVGKPGEYATCSPLSKEVLVLMVSGIGESFRIPVGISAEEKASLINETIFRLHQIDVKVVSITSDGPLTNIATSRILGAKFDQDKPYFQNPFEKDSVIYIILDPPHMLKLSRNCLGNKKIIYDGENGKIEWKYFEELVSIQIDKNMNLGNKITKTHIDYQSNKMNVRLAAETLSNSVASSFDYLRKIMIESFADSEATGKYARIVNNLFDIMNSKLNQTHFKRPLSEETFDEFLSYFKMAKSYLKSLSIIENGKKITILKSKSFTTYFGFYYNKISFIGIYKDHVITNEQQEFYTFGVSQDHIETFFGCIRSMGGIIQIHQFVKTFFYFLFFRQGEMIIPLHNGLLRLIENYWFEVKLLVILVIV